MAKPFYLQPILRLYNKSKVHCFLYPFNYHIERITYFQIFEGTFQKQLLTLAYLSLFSINFEIGLKVVMGWVRKKLGSGGYGNSQNLKTRVRVSRV